jgi:CSLREA domain-containing protein
LEQRENSSRWGVVIGIILLGVFLLATAEAAVFTVNSPFDASDSNPGDGVCETAPGNGVCTLRAAIEEANTLGAGDDTIILPPNTYLLTLVNELTINGDLTISGSGASTTIIDGSKSVRPDSGVLVVVPGITVSISGVTIRNGVRGTSGDTGGGGIFNSGTLTLSNGMVSGNTTLGLGGGIFNSGTLTLSNITVSANSGGFHGGGIFNSGTMTLTNSTVSGNDSSGHNGASGGGILNTGTLTLTNSTVSGNSVFGGGGGISNSSVFNSPGTLTLINSTVSGNRGGVGLGGGIANGGTANLLNATITNNTLGFGDGGGVSSGRSFNIQNTIIAGNFRSGLPSDCAGTINSNGNNLMGSLDRCTVNGGGVTLADPKLGPLQNNGGPTETHALLSGSPAIDGGNPSGCRNNLGTLLTTDQRGFHRPVDGNDNHVAVCDIGAFEFGAGAATTMANTVDFDGDGRSDISVYRDGGWFILRSSDGGVTFRGWGGLPQDITVPKDYDGDGKVDIAVYRDGTWYIIRSSDGGVTTISWGGLPEDIPVPADYDGDGRADVAVYRNGTWFIIRSSDSGFTTTGWGGLPQDIPVPADYDGDGKTDIAVYRDGIWFVEHSLDGAQTSVGWGGVFADIPLNRPWGQNPENQHSANL